MVDHGRGEAGHWGGAPGVPPQGEGGANPGAVPLDEPLQLVNTGILKHGHVISHLPWRPVNLDVSAQ